MNVERWLRTRRVSWQKLEELLKKVDSSGLGSLDRQGLTELGRLYRATSADLSRARALKLNSELQIYLNNLVVRAHNQVYQNKQSRLSDLFLFFLHGFPRQFQTNILYVLTAFLLFLLPGLGCYREALYDPNFGQLEIVPGQSLVSEELYHMIENRQMWTDSVQDSSPAVAGLIATNNIKVSLLAFATGITFGIGTVYVLIMNGMSIGTVFGVCQDYGMAHRLAAFVAGHGVIELMAIFISGGAGLMIGGAMLFPGQLSRRDSLKKVARPAMELFAGTVLMLLVAGTIEGFVSPRTDIGADVKYMVSAATAAMLTLYLLVPRTEPNKPVASLSERAKIKADSTSDLTVDTKGEMVETSGGNPIG